MSLITNLSTCSIIEADTFENSVHKVVICDKTISCLHVELTTLNHSLVIKVNIKLTRSWHEGLNWHDSKLESYHNKWLFVYFIEFTGKRLISANYYFII